MNAPHTYPEEELNKPVTLGILLEYTDEFLMPKIYDTMGAMMDEKIGVANAKLEQKMKAGNAKLEHNLKSYIDDKLADYTSDIFKRLDKKYEKDQQFKSKVVELFRAYNIGKPEDVAYLEGLVHGA